MGQSNGDQAPKTPIEKTLEQAELLATLSRLSPFIKLFGKRGGAIAKALDDGAAFAPEVRELASLPDRFNALLGPRGWIAFDRIDTELLRTSTELAEAGNFDEAEALLIAAFDDEDALRFQLRALRAVTAVRPRIPLLELAATDYLAGRYHASIPVVLAQIDGVVADVAGKTLFTKTKDILPRLVAWDSIAARDGGLPDLVALMATPRHSTTESPIEVPFRHGILHGRDLGYATKPVAAKTWVALLSLREWALKVEHGETEPPPLEPAPSLRKALRRYADVERQRRQIEAWRPRPIMGPLAEGEVPDSSTPEAAVMDWLSAWARRDFAEMAMATQVRRRLRERDLPQRLEEMFGFRHLVGFRIQHVQDKAASMTEVAAELRFDDLAPVVMTANVVFEDEEGNPVVRDAGAGVWGVNDISALRQTAH